MKLEKRNCPIKMTLHPLGENDLVLKWDIGNDHHEFPANAIWCDQFTLFLQAIYSLYPEDSDTHKTITRFVKQDWESLPEDIDPQHRASSVYTEFQWMDDNYIVYFRFSRIYVDHKINDRFKTDPVNVEIWHDRKKEGPMYTYTVEGRDLCYAVAKAVTDVLREKGIRGYFRSTGADDNCCQGDSIDLEQFLFIKAYALDAMDVRILTSSSSGDDWAESSSIEKEIELLLFEM